MIGGYIGSPIGGVINLDSSGITASLSVTEADDTLSATSTVQIQASAALTDADDTLSATATVLITANASLTEDDDTLSASASPMVVIIGSPTDEDDTLVGIIIKGIRPSYGGRSTSTLFGTITASGRGAGSTSGGAPRWRAM